MLAFAVISIVVLFSFGVYKLCINQCVESKALEQGEHPCGCMPEVQSLQGALHLLASRI